MARAQVRGVALVERRATPRRSRARPPSAGWRARSGIGWLLTRSLTKRYVETEAASIERAAETSTTQTTSGANSKLLDGWLSRGFVRRSWSRRRGWGVSTCFAASFCSGLAQRVSGVRVHHARLPYLRLILAPRALSSLYVAANASVLKSFSTGKPRNPLSLLRSSGDGVVMPLAALMRWL